MLRTISKTQNLQMVCMKSLVSIAMNSIPMGIRGQSYSSSQLHSRLARLIGKRKRIIGLSFGDNQKGPVSMMSNITILEEVEE